MATEKNILEKKTQVALGIENITSEDIFQEQRRAVSKIQPESSMFQCIKEKLEALF
ncbi:TPA: hypothetical protein ACL8T8_001216 [Streptococcus pneumoniae]|nr:hypothetical protein [Streptococcus pneumoniae]MBW8150536.1 hypothetical protein [Streptococcus pneumoniae]MDV8473948.1 hypothetical protein [Streptococcus pneumoniae]HET5664447.1 hypothetical protein [Streptococcus pneumoniae]HEV4501952.1 hypothetical protein [Streptococcus pneumoniae]HEV4590864.1 hypothetical protein [Streptococcus pneumoniae]